MKSSDVEVIVVGDEILKGDRPDAHLSFIAHRLMTCGVRVARAAVVGDDIDAISAAVTNASKSARVVILTGGLGPTPDDITRRGVAKAFELELEFHEPSWRVIQKFFTERGFIAADVNRQQAEFPAGSEVMPNTLGTAPGFRLERPETTVFVMPGPSIEVHRMFEESVVPRIEAIFGRDPVRVETFRTIGVGESHLRTILGDKLDAIQSYTVSYIPSRIAVDVVLTEKAGQTSRDLLDKEADRFEQQLREKTGNKFFERGNRSLFGVVQDLLIDRGETLAVAESLTGGWIGKQFTDLPGSSGYFLADVVAYSNEAKSEFLGVKTETLATFGAVSDEVCTEMAHGVRHRTGATYGLATTGIAGPAGATPQKPLGLTFIGVSWDGGCTVKRLVYAGTRDDVRQRACNGVVWLLFDFLRGL
jgi:nicotinamide-nucleotide amidase